MVISRSVPQQTAQMLSPLAGQNLFALRLLQIGQIKRWLLGRHCTPFAGDESWIMT
jgi:hypothetical protein